MRTARVLLLAAMTAGLALAVTDAGAATVNLSSTIKVKPGGITPTPPSTCGDGVVDASLGETCDPPGAPGGGNGNLCGPECTSCGDGISGLHEECDDGNGIDTDDCRNNCTYHLCGNGRVDNGETCDPPGSPAGQNGNNCRPDCTFCGDNNVNGGETCDDGNGIDTDGCRNDCTPREAYCGDGILQGTETCDPPGSSLPNGGQCRPNCTYCGDSRRDAGEACDDGNTNNDDSCRNDCTCPIGGVNVCANPQLGAASSCTVLQLNGAKIDMTGPAGGIQGDVCVGGRGKVSMSGSQYITGAVRLAPGATISKSGSTSVGSIVYNADLSAEVAAAYAASDFARGQACTMSFFALTSATTIIGGPGLNVVCIQDVDLNGGAVVNLTGGPTSTFILRVDGKFKLSGGSQIRAVGDVEPKDVLVVVQGLGEAVAFSGGGGGTSCCYAVLDGSLLAPNRKIALSPGLVNGDVISALDISIVSGSAVRCPAAPRCIPD